LGRLPLPDDAQKQLEAVDARKPRTKRSQEVLRDMLDRST